ncbi:MAG: hypothetical protein A3H97_17305 [Acidobacteria bacterium RIFCSPLOWO2_02_FULL_65_29]|nr:MAG: hypothetical protein A3H97_17305 [Acidobacteria bacterium RIFCSPLOWO2_02_FULL_65_29]
MAALALFISCGVPSSALAINSQDISRDYIVTAWGSPDGLSSGTVWAITQDAAGYLWLGTDMGLVRFDGVRFSRWLSFGSAQLPRAPIRSLCAARDGSLWVGFGASKGVSRLRDGQVQNYSEQDGMPPSDVTALVEGPNGSIWAAGSSGLLTFTGERWEQWQPGHGLPSGPMYSASVDRDGGLIVGTSSGVFRKRAAQQDFEPVEILDGNVSIADFSRVFGGDVVRAVVEDREGNIWVTDPIQGFRGIHDWQESTEKGRGAALLSDSKGNLWVGTWAQGLWRVTRDGPSGGLEIARAAGFESLVGDQVRSLLQDREGNIWAGTLDGLQRLSPKKVASITNVGLIGGVGVTPGGSVWLHTSDDHFEVRDGRIRQHDELRSYTRTLFRGFDVDNSGTVWVSTRSELLFIDGTRTGRVDLSSAGPLRSINTIASDRDGGVWLNDLEKGLLHWTRDRVETSLLPTELRRARIEIIYVDRAARTWLSFTDGRVATIDQDDGVEIHDVGESAGVYRAIYQDAQGIVWLGGSEGLTRYQGDRFTTLHRTEAFPADSISGIVQDEAGFLWLGTASGIIRIATADFDRAVTAPSSGLRHGFYDTSDGIAGTPRSFGKQGAARAPDGRLWFVTSRGVSILDPRVLSGTPTIAPVGIESVIANGRPMEARAGMSLPARTERLEFDYGMPTLTSPLKTRFRYRLEGVDTDWVLAGARRQAFYTGVAPGRYRFHVMAGNSDGEWAQPGAALMLSVEPAFYQTTWFLLGSALALVAIVGSTWRLHLRRVRKQFAIVLGERVRLSREIHDTLLQSLVGVALQCDALANDLEPSATSTKDQFYRLRRDVEDHVREARQAIWNLRSPMLDRRDLAAALGFVGRQAVAGSEVDLAVVVEGRPRPCAEAIEGQLLRIGQEAVINAVRHASATRINVELHYLDDAVLLRINDDGRGFIPESIVAGADAHYGLLSMRERAETVGGQFRISSQPGHGTTVEVSVPVAVAESRAHA